MESNIPRFGTEPDARNNDEESELSRTPPEEELITTLTDGQLVPIPQEKEGENIAATIASNMRSYRTLPSTSYSSLMPYQISQVYNLLRSCFPEPIKCVVDATAHIGGDSILFATSFPNAKVVAIDNDPNAVDCLRSNISRFSDPKRFEVVCASSVEWMVNHNAKHDREVADFYYFDPPWGGPKYFTKKEVSLTLDSLSISEVVNTVFFLGLSKKVLLKVPRNFAYPSFKSSVNGICKLFYIKKPQKNGSVAYGLILITDDRHEKL